MAEKEMVIKDAQIQWKGMFDFKLIYQKAKQWLENKALIDIKEEEYLEKIRPNGKQVEIRWSINKNRTSYIKLTIEMQFFIVGLQKVEVEEGGKKFLIDHGDIKIAFTSYITKNYDNKISLLFAKIYENIIAKKRIEDYKTDLYRATSGLMDELKMYLELYK